MNTQKPEPHSKGDGSFLDFHSMFYTLQGEGPFTGHRSIFVRLAGCNLQCPGCDTEYTVGRTELHIQQLLGQVIDLAAQHVGKLDGLLIVITGGEPLRQPIGKFVGLLIEHGFRVQIESNGVFAPDPVLNNYIDVIFPLTLVVSPKTKRINAETAQRAHCFKYVIDHRSINPDDGLPIMALEHPASTGVARPPSGRGVPIYVNPYDTLDATENRLNLIAAAESAMTYGYICGVQLHKLIGLE